MEHDPILRKSITIDTSIPQPQVIIGPNFFGNPNLSRTRGYQTAKREMIMETLSSSGIVFLDVMSIQGENPKTILNKLRTTISSEMKNLGLPGRPHFLRLRNTMGELVGYQVTIRKVKDK